MSAIVTRESLQAMIDNNHGNTAKLATIIGRALLVIFNNQTAGEKSANQTNVDNGIGFTGADSHSGCITAKYFLKHGTLLDWQIDRWIKPNVKGVARIVKYHSQLNAAAEARRTV